MAETTASASTSVTTKEGVQIKGKDVIMLNAPEVLLSPDTPLLTTAQDIAGAINELFMLDPGGGDFNGNFRAIIDSGGCIDIVVGEIPEGAEDEQHTDYSYTYSAQDFSEKITTETTTTSGDVTTTTTHTETFSKRIITELYDASSTLIMQTETDSEGNVLKYLDSDNAEINSSNLVINPSEQALQSAGSESAAIAWCIARNMEQTQSIEMQKKSYRKGLKQGVDGGADIREDYTQDSTNIDMITDEKGGISEPFIGSLTDGIYCYNSDGSYVYMWLDMSYVSLTEDNDSLTSTGRMVYETYNSSGALTSTRYEIGPSGWNRRKVDPTDGHLVYVGTHTNLWIDDNGIVYATYKLDHYDIGKTYYQTINWGSVGSNVVRIGNIPPEIIT